MMPNEGTKAFIPIVSSLNEPMLVRKLQILPGGVVWRPGADYGMYLYKA